MGPDNALCIVRSRLIVSESRRRGVQATTFSRSSLISLLVLSGDIDAEIGEVVALIQAKGIDVKAGPNGITITVVADNAPTEEARAVVEYWRAQCSPQSAVTKPRIALVLARMKEGATADRLRAAVDGALRSPWHCGENPDHRKYLGIQTIFRDADQIDKFAGLAGEPRRQTSTSRTDALLREALRR